MEEKYKEEFQNLNNYAEELKATNYESTVIVKSDSNAVFDRMYICFGALKRGFLEGCRPIIGLDVCFLKGLVKGQLLVVVGRDGNNQMFPIAWAVVHNENTETWPWFTNQLCDDLEIGDGLGWAVISDMQKMGKKNSGKELQYQFWVTARSPNEPEMRKQLDAMAELENGLAAKEDLLEHWPVQGWCQAFFSDVVKCDVIDNNMCETFNGVILEARCKPIISMLEEIRIYVMKRLVLKREYMKKWKTNYAPRILERLEKSRKLAMATIMYEGADPLSYLSEYFCKEMYKKAYMHMLNPVKGQMFWPKSNDGPLLPPLVKRMPGRPAKKRKREPLEGKNRNKLSRVGRRMTCGFCHKEGHNKSGCPTRQQFPGRPGQTILGRDVMRPASSISTSQLLAQKDSYIQRRKEQAFSEDIIPISTQESCAQPPNKGKQKVGC
ncbi:hypothetical protein PTKIN_Ptkin13bG0101500 [Pterospermum kingtungense]